MTGFRHDTGAPRRRDRRHLEHDRRVREAPTGKLQVAAAFDRYRSAAVRHPDADTELHDVATWLNERAKRIEREVTAA
jgi:hypothetical protein